MIDDIDVRIDIIQKLQYRRRVEEFGRRVSALSQLWHESCVQICQTKTHFKRIRKISFGSKWLNCERILENEVAAKAGIGTQKDSKGCKKVCCS